MASVRPNHPTHRPTVRLTFGRHEAARRTKSSTLTDWRKAPNCLFSIPARWQCRTSRSPPTPASTSRGRSATASQGVRPIVRSFVGEKRTGKEWDGNGECEKRNATCEVTADPFLDYCILRSADITYRYLVPGSAFVLVNYYIVAPFLANK